MTVDFQYELSDFIAFSKERRTFVPETLSRLYYFGIVPILGVGLAVVTQSFPVAAIFTVLYLFSGWFIQHHIQQLYRNSVYTADNLSFSKRPWRATLTDEGVGLSSDAAEILYRWPFIREVHRSSNYVYFVLTPLQRVRIPVRAFSNEEHIQKFISTAQGHVKRQAK